MDTVKNNITSIALGLFADKGFHNTSMQDIASACNISKATIYKYFTSKEDVILAAILAVNETALLECREINNDAKLTELEKLGRKIIVLFHIYQKKTEFISNAQYQLEGKQHPIFIPEIKASNIALYSDINQSISNAFALPSHKNSWDLFLVLKGSLQEISSFQKFIATPLDADCISDFLMDSLSAIVDVRSNKEPLISQAVNDYFKKYKCDISIADREKEIDFLLEKMRNKIMQLPVQIIPKKEKALALLKQEIYKTGREDADSVVAEAMLAYLSQSESLKSFTNQLKKTLNL